MMPDPVPDPNDADSIIARIAGAQHGVVARWQLLEAGVTVAAIEFRVTRRRLVPLHRGVYRVGPVGAPRAREMGAVLAAGRTALLSHTSAAALVSLVEPAANGTGVVHVTTRRSQRVPASHVRLHRVRSMPADEATRVDGIPVTTPARTLLDLASIAAPATVEAAFIEGMRRRLFDAAAVRALIARYPRRAGTPLLRSLLERMNTTSLVRSGGERKFFALMRRFGLMLPRANVIVAGYEVDFYWPAERVVAEVDGFAIHGSRAAFERDRRRDAALAAAGVTVVRVTWRQLVDSPETVAIRIGQALAVAAALRR